MSPAENRRILIVDDDYGIREALAEVLRDHDYVPLQARNGQDALDRLQAHPCERPCLILLDIMMPIMDGWRFRAVQAEDPNLRDIPVLILTANTSVPTNAPCLRKPVDLSVLLETVERFCPACS